MLLTVDYQAVCSIVPSKPFRQLMMISIITLNTPAGTTLQLGQKSKDNGIMGA